MYNTCMKSCIFVYIMCVYIDCNISFLKIINLLILKHFIRIGPASIIKVLKLSCFVIAVACALQSNVL